MSSSQDAETASPTWPEMPVQVTRSVLMHPTLSLAARGLYAVVAAGAQEVLAALPDAVRSELLSELIDAGYAWQNERGGLTVGDPTVSEPGDFGSIPRPTRSSRELSRAGWAYAIADDTRTMVKIGTTLDVSRRLNALQTSSPRPLIVLWQREGGQALEAHLHAAFASRRVRGEWFDFTGTDAVALIDRAACKFGAR